MNDFFADIPGPVLAIKAHPDDDSMCAAGTMAAAALAGHQVVSVTATRGEAGYHDPSASRSLAEIRTREHEAASRVIGAVPWFMNFNDGQMHEVPEETGVSEALGLIEMFQPRTVITFGPDGYTGHSDHKVISSWTTQAFTQAAIPGSQLLHVAATPSWFVTFSQPKFRRYIMMTDEQPILHHPRDLKVHVLTDALRRIKELAVWQHPSQIDHLVSQIGLQALNEFWLPVEAFTTAASFPALVGVEGR